MQVEINNKDSIMLPLLGHISIGTDEECDVVLSSNSQSPRKICSIINDQNVCMLEVFSNENLKVNAQEIKETAILHAGDVISIEDDHLIIVDENHLPKECTAAFKLIQSKDLDEHLVTSVTGLRSFNPGSTGELALVGDKNSFTHKPISDDDIGFAVSYVDDNLTMLCKKDTYLSINGNQANYAILRNGDYITTKYAKYCVESPGTSSFSKYSPSHPRNIQLSQEYLVDEEQTTPKPTNFVKKNLWWLSLVAGLVIISIILFAIKNN